MKTTTLAILAGLTLAIPFTAAAAAPSSPASRTASLLASGAEVPIHQIAVEVNTGVGRPVYNDNYYRHHHRQYRTVRVVRYRHGVRYVSYRRVYYAN